MSYLSVFVQYHAQVRVAFVVPAAAFEPAPAVDSAVLVGATRPRRLEAAAEDELWRLVQAGFRERRKMLHNVLPRQLPGLERDRLEAALAACAIAPERRPQTLSVDEWLPLRPRSGRCRDAGRARARPAVGRGAGQGQPRARRHGPARRRLPHARSVFLRLALHDHLEVARRPTRTAPDELDLGDRRPGRVPTRPREPRAARRGRPAGGLPGPSRCRPCASASTSTSRWRPAWPAAARTPRAALELAAAAWGLAVDRSAAAGRWRWARRRRALLRGEPPGGARRAASARTPRRLPAPRPPAGILLVTVPDRLLTVDVFAELDRRAAHPGRWTPGRLPPAPGAAAAAVDALAAALRSGLDGAAPGGPGRPRSAMPTTCGRARRASAPAWSRAARCARGARSARPGAADRLGPTLVALYPSPRRPLPTAARDLDAGRVRRVLRDATITATSSSP